MSCSLRITDLHPGNCVNDVLNCCSELIYVFDTRMSLITERVKKKERESKKALTPQLHL